MIKMISVATDETLEFTITFSNLSYQLRKNGNLIFQDKDFYKTRGELLKITGV